jgi:signal transduction histidine kinase/ActR/RegA family two-component response regulator
MTEGPRDLDLLSGWLSQTAEIERLGARFEALARTAPVGVAVMTRERLLFANDQITRQLGGSAEGLPARSLSRLFPEASVRARVREALRRAWNGSPEDLGVVPITRDDGSHCLASVTLRLLPRELEPVLMVVVDDGARGAHSPARPEGHDTLRAFGLYLAGLANDLRGPLTAYLGHLTLLTRRTDLPEDLREAFELYRQVTSETLDRFGRAMEWGRRVPLMEHVDLRAVVEAAAATFAEERAPAEVILTLELAAVPPVAGSSAQLQLALEHVLRNAGEAMASQGGRIEVTLTSEGQRIRLAVKDDGPGIPDSLLPHVFEPFASTKSITSGMGLGLAIVKDIVTRHQGEIVIDSRRTGTTVTFLFDPVADASPAARASSRKRVLLVEDNPAVQETYRMLLEKGGWEVLPANDTDEALMLLTRESVDALIVDVQMAGRDGLALVEALATWHPHLLPRTALHTAYSYEDRVRGAVERYGVALLSKPCPIDTLVATLHKLTGGPA